MRLYFFLALLIMTTSCTQKPVPERTIASVSDFETAYDAFEKPSKDSRSVQARIFNLLEKNYDQSGMEFITKNLEGYSLEDERGDPGISCVHSFGKYQCNFPQKNREFYGKHKRLILSVTEYSSGALSLFDLLPMVKKEGQFIVKYISDDSLIIKCTKVRGNIMVEECRVEFGDTENDNY